MRAPRHGNILVYVDSANHDVVTLFKLASCTVDEFLIHSRRSNKNVSGMKIEINPSKNAYDKNLEQLT
jgi:hypothetical protein